MIACFLPTTGTKPERTSEDIDNMNRIMRASGEPWFYGPIIGASQPSQMNLGIKEALKLGASHAAVIEHDHRFPPDAFLRLREHKKPIIGANYRQRQRREWTTIKGRGPIHSYGKRGIEEVDSVGLGVCLIDLSIFKTLPQPWFLPAFAPDADRYCTVDVFFCHLARQHGFSVWVDHDLSQSVAHIDGTWELWPDRLVFTNTQETFCNIPPGFDKDPDEVIAILENQK